MNFYCKHCRKPLMHGQQMCSCGQLFDNPVPENDGQVGVVYWEPPRPSSRESQVQRVKEAWDGTNPAIKAGGFGALAVLLIAFAIVGSHHPTPATHPQIVVAPVMRSVTPVQPSMLAPVIRGRPAAQRPANGGSRIVGGTANVPAYSNQPSSQPGNDAKTSPTAGQPQAQAPQPQQPDVAQQVAELNQQGMNAYSDTQSQVDASRCQEDINTLESCISKLKEIDPDGTHGSQADYFESDLLPAKRNTLNSLQQGQGFGSLN